MRRAEKAGYKAFVLTTDAPASGVRQRASRFGVYSECVIARKGVTEIRTDKVILQDDYVYQTHGELSNKG